MVEWLVERDYADQASMAPDSAWAMNSITAERDEYDLARGLGEGQGVRDIRTVFPLRARRAAASFVFRTA
jgi:hypothetical protein